MSLDHGILNLPLAKRGNINAQLDAYKANQAAISKAARKDAAAATRATKAQAKLALAELIAADGLLDAKAVKIGSTSKALIAVLTEWSKWTPSKVVKVRAEWMAK